MKVNPSKTWMAVLTIAYIAWIPMYSVLIYVGIPRYSRFWEVDGFAVAITILAAILIAVRYIKAREYLSWVIGSFILLLLINYISSMGGVYAYSFILLALPLIVISLWWVRSKFLKVFISVLLGGLFYSIYNEIFYLSMIESYFEIFHADMVKEKEVEFPTFFEAFVKNLEKLVVFLVPVSIVLMSTFFAKNSTDNKSLKDRDALKRAP